MIVALLYIVASLIGNLYSTVLLVLCIKSDTVSSSDNKITHTPDQSGDVLRCTEGSWLIEFYL